MEPGGRFEPARPAPTYKDKVRELKQLWRQHDAMPKTKLRGAEELEKLAKKISNREFVAGRMAEQLGRYEEALEHYQHALKLAPGNAEIKTSIEHVALTFSRFAHSK